MSKDINDLIRVFEEFSYDCKDSDICTDCGFSYFCEAGWSPNLIVDELKRVANINSVRHGHWIGEADGYADGELVYDVWFCSECDYTFEYDANPNGSKHHAYCPVCGAKMDMWLE